MSEEYRIYDEKVSFVYLPDEGRLFKIEEITITGLEPDGKYRPKSSLFNGLLRLRTHLVFFIMTGRWPLEDHVIDHVDRDGANNKWTNLREANRQQNAQNRTLKRTTSNVERTAAGRFRVKIAGLYLGTYNTEEEAVKSAEESRNNLYGEFSPNLKDVP